MDHEEPDRVVKTIGLEARRAAPEALRQHLAGTDLDAECMRLWAAFLRIKDPKVRKAVTALVESMARAGEKA